MPDLFDPFTDLREVPPAFGSAADARHRGDRLRRRRTATVVAGSALAVALTVGGVAWSQVGTPGTSPAPVAPAPTPSTPDDSPTLPPEQTPSTAIASGFPLADGWPEADGEELRLQGPSPRLDALDGAVVCGEVRDLRPTGAVEQLGARLSGIVFGGDRLLVTFPEAADARAALAQTVAALDRCPASPDAPAGEEVLVSKAEPVGLGEEAVRVTMGSQVDGEWALNSTIYHVVRQGNALLLAYDSGKGGGSDAAIAIEQRTSARAIGGVVEAMCVYRDGGC